MTSCCRSSGPLAAVCGLCPRLGGDFGEAIYLNEFGRIAGYSTTAAGAVRATLWTPTARPLLADAADEAAEPEIASATAPIAVQAVLCARSSGLSEWSRLGLRRGGRASPDEADDSSARGREPSFGRWIGSGGSSERLRCNEVAKVFLGTPYRGGPGSLGRRPRG
jgi:hypothetical protein